MELHSRRPMSRSFDSAEPKPIIDVIMDCGTARRVQIQSNPRVTILKEHKMRSRSMPLENGSAEETALRVIRECLADDLYSDDLDYIANIEAVQNCDGDGYGGAGSLQNKMTGQGCFSPKWQSSHKWVKVLISPMMSRNRVFPSRSKEVRKGKGSSKRLTRFPSSDWSRKDANDDKLSPHWRKQAKTGSKTTIRSSVLSWLQPDAAKPRPKKQKQMELCTSSSSSCGMSHSGFTDPWLKDLITVGHLHEIAEEHEIFSDDEADNLESINSFGKFLLIAAQRQPKAGLTRISSATF
nr:uncharacterized protein LOC112275711 isoform X2 [Physcomitrium patens]|eukprot:XP_024362083.1 uncharacterized protein LOC112275711 isoform X2 [Physcomitrella patens]